MAIAQPELAELKIEQEKRVKPDARFALWRAGIVDGGLCGTSSSVSIYIEQGKARPITGRGPITDQDPNWVTVTISSDLDESWVNVIRYTFFSIPDE